MPPGQGRRAAAAPLAGLLAALLLALAGWIVLGGERRPGRFVLHRHLRVGCGITDA